MFRQKIKALDSKVSQILHHTEIFEASADLENFYLCLSQLHDKIRSYLHEKLSQPSTEPHIQDKAEQSEHKSLFLPLGDITPNEEESGSSVEEGLPKSLIETQPTKKSLPKNNKEHEVSLLRDNKRLSEAMEKIDLIIEYQSKIQKLLISMCNNSKVTEILGNENLFQPNTQPCTISSSFQEHSSLAVIRASLDRVFEECKEIKDQFQEIQDSQSQNTVKSISDSQDKKSLLTEMLRESQLNETTEDLSQITPRKVGKRQLSEFYGPYAAGKKPLKEIDFSGYKIEGAPTRRERRPKGNNMGQCSQCTIF